MKISIEKFRKFSTHQLISLIVVMMMLQLYTIERSVLLAKLEIQRVTKLNNKNFKRKKIYLFFVPLFSEMENHHHHQNHAGMPMMTKNEEPMGSMMNSDSQSEPMNHMHHSSSMSPAMDHMMKM